MSAETIERTVDITSRGVSVALLLGTLLAGEISRSKDRKPDLVSHETMTELAGDDGGKTRDGGVIQRGQAA